MNRFQTPRRQGRAAPVAGLLFLGVLASGTWNLCLAQCPDGTPPPCAAAARPRPAGAVAIDPHRIAVLPFRVSAADTLLGEGMAELLATEFTGEGGPRAVDMGTALRAWRRAGGGLRSPLSQGVALRVARELGAGLLVQGSVVGLASRLTVAASVLAVPGGTERGRVLPVAGPSDSLEAILRRVTAALLVAAGGEAPRARGGGLSESPQALRAYLEGLALFRRSRTADAARAFERALAEDSLFARAAFMRFAAGGWTVPPSTAGWAGRTWRLRERLSAQDRVLLEADVGARYPEPRRRGEALAERRRAVELLPESPEAWYLLGDHLYHAGATYGLTDQLEQARRAFERSVALDSQATVLYHLLEIAAYTGDTTLFRAALPGYERIMGDDAWGWSWMLAVHTGDAAARAGLRRRAAAWRLTPDHTVFAYSPLFNAVYLRLPADAYDEMQRLLGRRVPADSVARWAPVATITAGRSTGGTAAFAGALVSWDPAVVALFADGDTAAGAAHVRALRKAAPATEAEQRLRDRCTLALWDVTHGVPVAADSLLEHGHRNCHEIVMLLEARRAGTPDWGERLAPAESIIRGRNVQYAGFENLVLARLWEARGDLTRARAALRARPYGYGNVITEAPAAREEGRLALLAGDTAAAIGAYRRYLDMRLDPRPALVPQRDSVRAALAALERRRP